jgi:hypothetical protein
MGLTLVEKILSEHAGHPVKPGELIIAKVDVAAQSAANIIFFIFCVTSVLFSLQNSRFSRSHAPCKCLR